MSIKRRKVLYFLACATGWPIVKGGTASGEMIEKNLTGESVLEGSQSP
jgi:hypothetical protein